MGRINCSKFTASNTLNEIMHQAGRREWSVSQGDCPGDSR